MAKEEKKEKDSKEEKEKDSKEEKNAKSPEIEKVYDTLSKQVKEDTEASLRGLNSGLKIKIGLLIFIIIYMAVLYHYVSMFNAGSAMEAILGSVKNDTAMRQNIIKNLNDSAENNVTQFYDQLILAVPQIRGELEKVILTKIDDFAGNLEKEFNASLDGYIKAQIDAININKKSKDAKVDKKLDMLIGNLRNDFKTLAFGFTEQITKEASQDLVKLNNQLKKLQVGNGLDDQEKLERNLLCIWVKILNMEMKDTGTGK